MAETTAIDASLCPLCQQANQCAMEVEKASGIPQAACWCTTRKIDVALLSQIPPESRGLACICARCASPSRTVADTPSTQQKDNHANVPH